MQISGAKITENGTSESTTNLSKGKFPPEQVFSAQIINGTLSESTEVNNKLRSAAMHSSGKAQNVDAKA